MSLKLLYRSLLFGLYDVWTLLKPYIKVGCNWSVWAWLIANKKWKRTECEVGHFDFCGQVSTLHSSLNFDLGFISHGSTFHLNGFVMKSCGKLFICWTWLWLASVGMGPTSTGRVGPHHNCSSSLWNKTCKRKWKKGHRKHVEENPQKMMDWAIKWRAEGFTEYSSVVERRLSNLRKRSSMKEGRHKGIITFLLGCVFEWHPITKPVGESCVALIGLSQGRCKEERVKWISSS